MKMKTLILTTTLLAMATGGAFAQAGGATSGQGGAMSGQSGVSGTGPTPAQKAQTQKDKSPGSTDAGSKQEK
jgi:hypothetical protein